MNMKRLLILGLLSSLTVAMAADKINPFIGSWDLIIPDGGAGWLSVEEKNGTLNGSLLWGGGSVLPIGSVKVDGNTLTLVRTNVDTTKDPQGKQIVTREVQTIRARVKADKLSLTTETEGSDGKVFDQGTFTGKRTPPLPPKPDLAKVKFGEPITLFNGKNLDGWRLVEPENINGWFVKDGVLCNDPKQEEGKPPKDYGNLRTKRKFEDFNLKLEVNVPKRGNSGIYLRGIYEVQINDSYGRKLDSHNMGAIYSRICPAAAAEKPTGEWQTFDITLVDRHATVILNGKKIIDNQPLLGCTGGALWSDQSRPGPIYLQGDHTAINYRNIVLRPVVK